MPILEPGRNCWRITRAARCAVLVDAAAYYAAFHAAALRAEHSIAIVGWDINSRVRLLRDGRERDLPVTLREFLRALVRRRRSLHVYLLEWDFAMIYALERESVPLVASGWGGHRRIHFHFDAEHPLGASHHQKIVVIDDALAFCGGMDLSISRWDTPEHLADDPRRIDPDGTRYAPMHDLQMMVDGQSAGALAELARARWRRATHRAMRPPRPAGQDLWPAQVAPQLREVPIAVARTVPAYDGQPGTYEVRQLHLDAIAAAQRWIYIENQYFTSNAVSEALAARLAEPDGPEVVLVLPQQCPGWLEQNTMGVLRARLLRRLRAADRGARLRVYSPCVPDLQERCLTVHSKLLIADDRLLRIGSANASNRSMGFDSECDLALEADEARPELAAYIGGVRNRLLAEHLERTEREVAQALATHDSLIGAIETLGGRRRTLEPLDGEVSAELDGLLPDSALIDPERPISADQLVNELVPGDMRKPADHSVLKAVSVLVVVLGLAAAWRWTPLKHWLDVESLVAWVRVLRHYPAAPLLFVGAYVMAALVLVPVTLLVVATALAFGALEGFGYALLGSLLAAAAGYGIGALLGRDTVRRLGGSFIGRLSQRLARRGILAVITVRFLPVAPFTVVNLVAGASHIRFRDFALGTLAGMVPGLLGLTFFTDQLATAFQDPATENIVLLGALLVLLLGGAWTLRRLLRRRAPEAATAQTSRERSRLKAPVRAKEPGDGSV